MELEGIRPVAVRGVRRQAVRHMDNPYGVARTTLRPIQARWTAVLTNLHRVVINTDALHGAEPRILAQVVERWHVWLALRMVQQNYSRQQLAQSPLSLRCLRISKPR